ncbi:sulfatase [Halomonas huangheensis]|uniref:Sulfatase N-terminal domain-containing protein n=1 Tax=Halomonas huangheensis TaxID=1178482 RepID=W1N7Z7_9GAMM|nr:sulfatase-like hydrolase/transferase [Halomonas huangheensis]ERL51035.1 hypothetical protein BJB45_20805 [Halomonas huangheensis]
MNKRPNFLFIITDQQRADHLGCAGNPVLKTPHIDSIAARGTRFSHFHAASPLCMPARATLMTGRMPSSHRLRGNGMPLSTDATTVTELLKESGYRTALIGKCHLQSMMSEAAIEQREPRNPHLAPPPEFLEEAFKPHAAEGPYDQELEVRWESIPAHEIKLPYYGFEHVDLCINHGDLAHGHYGRWLKEQHPDPTSLRGPENALPADIIAPEAWRTRMPVELYSSTYVADRTIDHLKQLAASNDDKPFFLQCSFPDPHHPFTPPGEYFDLYRPEDVELPPSFHQPLDDAIPQVRHVRELLDAGKRDIDIGFAFAVNEAEARQAIALTYGMIALIDDSVGRILATLKELGMDDNTIIIYTSDHGDFMGDHRLLLKGPLHYRGVTQVPFIWSDPTLTPEGSVYDKVSSSVDFVPTVLERAGLQPFNGIQGKSLLGAISGNQQAIHESVLIEEENQRNLFGEQYPPRARTLVDESFRVSIYNNDGWGELYDLKNDPWEMKNLWHHPDYAQHKSLMLEKLARKMLNMSDRSPFPTMRA